MCECAQVMQQNRLRNPIRQTLGSIVHGAIVDRLPFGAVGGGPSSTVARM